MKNKKLIYRGLSSTCAFLLVLSAFGTNIALSYAGTINSYLGTSSYKLVDADTENEDTEYYKSAYGELSDENLDKVIADAYQQAVTEEAEGAVLLKNDQDALPLTESERRVTLFGHAVAQPLYKPSSGGATIEDEHVVSFYDAMKNSGFEINDTLFDAYAASSTTRSTGVAQGPGSSASDPTLGEEPASFYTDELKASWENDYQDAAIVMLARQGGEDTELSVKDSEGISQLALHQDEKDLLQMIRDSGKFDKIIVVLNSPWTMELGWLDEYGVDACLWIGSPGLRGFEAVAEILAGEVNPSGKLVDTYAASSVSAPAVTNGSGNTPSWANLDEVLAGCSDDDQYVSYYTVYAEGIYVGYKYYETRYEDLILDRFGADSQVGSSTGKAWNYADEICYPFGYGLSYTTFEQSLDSVEKDGDNYILTVTVSNTGDKAGKSVVEVYAQKPYGEYEINNKVESSAVQLVGFNKTGMIEPGASETVKVEVEEYLLASYDYTNAKTYILSEGDYYLALGDNAHDALNNILAAKDATGMYDENGEAVDGDAAKTYQWNNASMDSEKYRYSKVTGAEVTNQFEDADINNWIDDAVTYLSRSDWEGTYPESAVTLSATPEMIEAINGYTYEKPADAPSVSSFTQGADNGLTFAAMKDVDYDDDETWNKFLDQLTLEEMCTVLKDFNGSPAISSVMKPEIKEGDGIDGVAGTYLYGDNRSAVVYPGKLVLASTWNIDVMAGRGSMIAEEAMYCGQSTVWGGGNNIHRTPFSGRNFEYYSEDGTFAYLVAAAELKPMQEKGINAAVKHFVANDQEAHRESLATFFNEQSFRENNLRAFESAFVDGGVLTGMQAFNRIGCTYVAQSTDASVAVLRNEWGYKGRLITDAVVGMSYKTHYAECMAAGTDYFCWDGVSFGGNAVPDVSVDLLKQIKETDDGYLFQRVREANKNLYYVMSKSIAVNGLSSTGKLVIVTPWWELALKVLSAVCAVLTALFIILYVKNEYFSKKRN